MMTNRKDTTTLTMPSERETVITHEFNAPRKLVFEAITQPEHVKNWYGPREMTMVSCEIDLRVGGTWRYVVHDPRGNEHGFTGEYREIVPPERLVSTEGYEAMPGHEYLVTITLNERDGKTKMTNRMLYKSQADRDGHASAGMEPGMRETYQRLDELLEAVSTKETK